MIGLEVIIREINFWRTTQALEHYLVPYLDADQGEAQLLITAQMQNSNT
jgi:hypothetical protein